MYMIMYSSMCRKNYVRDWIEGESEEQHDSYLAKRSERKKYVLTAAKKLEKVVWYAMRWMQLERTMRIWCF